MIVWFKNCTRQHIEEVYLKIPNSFAFWVNKKDIDGKLWIVDRQWNKISKRWYDDISRFSHGLVSVQRNGKWWYMNKRWKEVIPCQYDGPRNFGKRKCLVIKNGKEIIINRKWNII